MILFRDAALLLVWVALAGWAAGRGFRPLLAGLSRAETLAWSTTLGFAIEILISLAVLAVGARPGPLPMGAGLATVVFASLLARPARLPVEERVKGLAAVFVAAAVAAALLFAIAAISEPMWSNDFLAIWGLKGKTIAMVGSIPGRLFHDPVTRWSHPEYPLLVPLVLAASAAVTGGWNDQALAVLYPVFQVVLLATLYGATRRRFGALAGSLIALLGAAFFWFFRSFSVGMADIPLTAFLVLFAVSTIDFLDSPSRPAGARLAISSFLCAATKQEGSLFVLLACAWATFLVLRRHRSRIVPFLSLTAVPVFLQELVLIAARGWIADRDYDWRLLRQGAALAPRIAAVAGSLLRVTLLPQAIPVIAVAGFIAFARPARGANALALLGPPLAAQMAVYAAVSVISAFDARWQAGIIPRLAGTLFPVLLLGLAPRVAFSLGSDHRKTGSPDADHADSAC